MGDIGGLAGVLVYTAPGRFDVMADFYVGVLGLEPRSRRPGFVNFEWGDRRLTVAAHSELGGLATDPLRIMVNLCVSDLDATADRLVAAGVRFMRPPETESWGGRVATLTDPDGNVIQLLEFPA